MTYPGLSLPAPYPTVTRSTIRQWLASRMWVIASAFAYVIAFQYAYIYVVAPAFDYLGFTYGEAKNADWWLAFLLAFIPALWLPGRLRRPSQWFYLYIYIAVYVPVCMVPLYRAAFSGRPVAELYPLWGVTFICFSALGIVQFLPIPAIRIRPIDPRLFWGGITLLLIGAYIILYVTFGANLRFAGDDLVREQRLQGRELFAASSMPLLVGYSMSWPSYAINPFLIAYGICSKRYRLVLLGIAGELFLYTTNAARGVLAAALIPFLMLFLLKRAKSFGARTLLMFSTGLATVCVLASYSNTVIKLFWGWLISRTFATSGLLTDAYYTFFSVNPFTGFSQVHGFSSLIWNPYNGRAVGFIIGDSLNQFGNQANANFWADGYASFGFLGMLIVTAIAVLAMYAMDIATQELDLRFIVLLTAAQAMTLADISIFTELFGQGLIFVVLLGVLGPRVPGIRRAEAT